MSDAPPSNFTPAPLDSSKRTWLLATTAVGAAGTVVLATPFVGSFSPSEKAKAAGAAVEVDISALQPGEKMIVEWRGQPVWVFKRTPEMLATLKGLDPELADPMSKRTDFPTPEWAQNEDRAREEHKDILVVVGICTHLGCSPVDKFKSGPQPSLPDNWEGGFFCPCHGSTFDFSARVFKNKPAPSNLVVPPYVYLSDTRLLIGEDTKKA
ncbi:MAG TPA: ubiquinol-cytochrome c reductase iron-sulfur subunit [Ottowia sp.]|uniref:ubiquinol-cytochrome c reductase iron-sulfur subunit n=1 Tax=Ottowia sp. TaxID=1898956 RepID=UPI002C01763A|nr:ubiquinol-cytochrome c reductase iron-sulfur subunit [Ottowia sp.]HMN19883.1 ubiquinol-cytochrome c reductase iron-sulfur subunit [Ottowia sp.]